MFFARSNGARHAEADVIDDVVGLPIAIVVEIGAAVARTGWNASGVSADGWT
jgi:hypothetical protein